MSKAIAELFGIPRFSGFEKDTAAIAFCILASFSATFLSGIEFPAFANMWNIPVALHFAGSAEGPHDAYNMSYDSYISAFWLLIGLFANEQSIETIFISLQVVGNSFLAFVIYLFVRHATGLIGLSAIVSAGFCFCYGLWGKTQLGYSDLFAPYSIHTQYAIVLCLLGLFMLIRGRVYWATIIIGTATYANLYMGFWSALSAMLYLVATERRLFSRQQLVFSVLLGLLVTPELVWALRSGATSSLIPLEFFDSHLRGHIYALSYPRAALQTFALGFAAGLAALAAGPRHPLLVRLGIVTLSCVVILGVGGTMPYVTDKPLLLMLHPLRFVSVIILLTVICAGGLLVSRLDTEDVFDPLPAFIATAGFCLRSPLVSIFGFSLLLSECSPKWRRPGLGLSVVGLLSVLFSSQMGLVSTKGFAAYFLMCSVLAAATWRYDISDSRVDNLLRGWSVGLLGAIAIMPASSQVTLAALTTLPSVVVSLTKVPTIWRNVALVLNVLASALLLWSPEMEVGQLTLVAAGLFVVTTASFWPTLRNIRRQEFVRNAALVAPILLFMAVGLAKGASARFGAVHSAEWDEFRDAQAWARANTPADTMFFTTTPRGAEFTLFSRRPIWWSPDMYPAAEWAPPYYRTLRCREIAINAAQASGRMDDLFRDSNVEYIIAEKDNQAVTSEGFVAAFNNAHYVILHRTSPKSDTPLCPE